MRKKMLLVVCSVILCISIIGCGASKEKENNSIQIDFMKYIHRNLSTEN